MSLPMTLTIKKTFLKIKLKLLMFWYLTVVKILKGFTKLLFMNFLLFPKETGDNFKENASFIYFLEPNFHSGRRLMLSWLMLSCV
jgi:hypothetical protein